MELLFILSISLSAIVISLFLSLLRTSNSGENIPLAPGSSGWPFIGETLKYFSNVQKGCPQNFSNERRKKYSSKVFKTSLIGQTMAILGGAEGNKFLFSNENKLVRSWWPAPLHKIFPNTDKKADQQHSINVRKSLSASLKADVLKNFVGTADVVMKQYILTDWENRTQIKASHSVSKYTFSLACRLFLSIDDPTEVERLAKPIEDIARGILSMAINIPGTAFSRAVNSAKALRKDLEGMIKKRKIELLEKGVSPVQDILSLMLVATDENGNFSNESDIANYIVGLLNGGYATINASLTFIIMYMAEHPDVYSQVLSEQREIAKSKEPKELLKWEDLRKMKYSWNVANEVLRLTPPVFGTFREAITDFTYDGYMIPKQWKLHWIAHDTHMNSEYFPHPEKFDPTRFEGQGPAPYTFVPFGGGPRMCPGNEYARIVILVFMHNVVTKFKWDKLIHDEEVISDPHPRLAQGLPIFLYPH